MKVQSAKPLYRALVAGTVAMALMCGPAVSNEPPPTLGNLFANFAGLQFGVAPGTLGSPNGTMTGYNPGDGITLACPGVAFSTPPVLGVTATSGANGAVTAAMVSVQGVTSGSVPTGAATCSQAGTNGTGAGYTTTVSFGVLAAGLSMPVLSTGGGASNSNLIVSTQGQIGAGPYDYTFGPENTVFGVAAGAGLPGNSGYNAVFGGSACGNGQGLPVSALSPSSGNVCVGNDAARNMRSPNGGNTIIGTSAGRNMGGFQNVIVGNDAVDSNSANTPGSVTGYSNVVTGAYAARGLVGGIGNVLLGTFSGSALVNGIGNVQLDADAGGGDNCSAGEEYWVVSICAGAGRVFQIVNSNTPASSVATVSGSLKVAGTAGITVTKASAAPSTAPGAGAAQFFLVPGANAGTCKLQIVAGTSVTPVTIADNIGGGC